jgi:serine/threonine protein kinase/ketosteroid isomerase-like protein
MELVEGQPLGELLQCTGKVSVSDAVEIARQITEGLEAAYRAGVVHGNLRLSNIFVSRDRHNCIEVKILDFGFARMRSLLSTNCSEHGRIGSANDTLHYVAPEQRGGRRPDERSDVYSLGVILYELLAGGPIVTGTIPIAEIALSEDLRPLRQMREDVSESLWQLIKQSLNEKPTERPWSAAVFARQLYNLERPELPFRETGIELPVLADEPQPAVDSLSITAVDPDCVSLATDFVVDEIAPPDLVKNVESPQPFAELEMSGSSSNHGGVDYPEIVDVRSDDEEPYVEEEGWELEQVDRVLTGTLPASNSRTRAATSLSTALNSIPVVLTGAASRLNSPTARRAFVALMLSVIAIAAGAMIIYLLSSARSYVSQAKSPIAASRPSPETVQAEQAKPAAVSVPSSAVGTQLAPLSAPAARPIAAPQASPTPAENTPADQKEQVTEPAPDIQGEEQALRAVFDRWLTATNNRDVDSQMDLYLDEIDTFYRSRHPSLDDVREHKAMVYNRASSIDMRASDPEIKIDDGGQKATMRFRKEWVIKGKSSSRGRATQELRLAKTEGGWKITGERNIGGNGG